jgi:GT2 family glycosyltransferase
MRPPDLSVIVVSWMSREHLPRCLGSIERSRGALDVETWVIDNASTDGAADFVAAEHPAVKLVRNDDNVGFARAVNQALAGARGRHVMLMNPDSEALADALPEMVRFMDAHPRAGIATGRLENPDGSIQRGCRRLLPTPGRLFWRLTGLPLIFPRSRLVADYNLTGHPEDRAHPVEAVSGAFLVIRRETLNDIGPRDESFFMYGEDLDWCARARAAGWEIMYHPGARVVHLHRASSRKNRARTIRALHEAGEIYYRKHLAADRPWIVGALVTASLRSRAAILLAGAWLEETLRRGGRKQREGRKGGAALVRDLR